MLSIEKFGGYTTEVKQRIEIWETLALRNKVKEEQHLNDIQVKRRDRNEFAQPT